MDGVNADNTYAFSIAQLNINIHGYKTYSQEDCSSLRRKPEPTIVHFLDLKHAMSLFWQLDAAKYLQAA